MLETGEMISRRASFPRSTKGWEIVGKMLWPVSNNTLPASAAGFWRGPTMPE